MAKSKVKVTSYSDRFIAKHTDVMEQALEKMGNDVLRIAKTRVPRKDNTLTNSGKTEKKSALEMYVSFGNDGSAAGDYAAVQERGKRNSSKQFTNYTSPGTGANFLKNAGEKVGAQTLNYLKQAAKKIRGS